MAAKVRVGVKRETFISHFNTPGKRLPSIHRNALKSLVEIWGTPIPPKNIIMSNSK
tara:strand:- start:93 stop:260 length:168 start_codon:yes stop_codon:yes gene_type:complete